ncbi:hypothetical protein TW65_01018 [Stemphylium lycopersici]|nr:hypothetical protein TW65_01018 [Stemphylium lycopersici]
MAVPRNSLRAFLAHARGALRNAVDSSQKITFVIGNESADLDSMSCSILYAYIRSMSPPKNAFSPVYVPITNIPAADIQLRPEYLAVFRHANIESKHLITLDDLPALSDTRCKLAPENTKWILVDHNALQGQLGKIYADRVLGVIDHHDDEGKVPADTGDEPRIIEKSGSCTSLIVNYCRQSWDALSGSAMSSGAAHAQGDSLSNDAAFVQRWDADVAQLGLASILIDTANLNDASKTTEHDREAVEYLEAKIMMCAQLAASFDRTSFYKEMDAAKKDIGSLKLQDILRKDYKQWDQGQKLGVSSVVKPIEFLQEKAGHEASTSPAEAFLDAMKDFAKERELDMFSLMTTSTSGDGQFRRELVLWAFNESAVLAAKRFATNSRDELGLEEWQGYSDLDDKTVSPTVTHLSSRSHTPLCHTSQVDDPPAEAPPRSCSPPRSPSPRPSKPPTATMGTRPGPSQDAASDRHGLSNLQRPQMSASMSAPAGRLPRLLPADLSSYTDSYLPTAAIPPSATSLAELAHLIRLQGYQEQRKTHARVRLHRWLVSSALSARLVHCGELAYRTLVDNFRSDDKKSFSSLYNALNDVRNSCDATRQYALLEPDLEFGKSKSMASEKPLSASTFLNDVPSKILDHLFDFISEIRTNPEFLATRISTLSQQELTAITSFRQAMDPIDSVMAMQARGRNVGSQKAQQQGANPIERLLSFQRHDPLSALIYTIFANSSGPDSAEDLRRTDVWATVCAKLIKDTKISHNFIRTILDVWAGMREWPGKANLELYLMQTLQDGQFLLEKAEESGVRSASQPVPRSTKDTIAADEFFDRAVKRLFEVVDDEPSAGGIPEGVLEIGNAILRKLNEENERGARKASQNFFTHGIMIGHHISEHARQKILKEIAIRAQKQVLDMTYNWKQQNPVLPEIRTHVENILARFKHTKTPSKPILLPAKAITSPRETVEVQPFIVLSPADIVTLVNALFPERRPSSSHMDNDSQRRAGLASSASSMSGMSVPFRNAAASMTDASSILSASASSMTSDQTSREPLLDSNSTSTEQQTDVRPAPTELYGKRLRMACSEMTRILGAEAASGSCHPCAERWAVLYISADGKQLKPRMRKDFDDEEEHDEDSPDSDSSDDEGTADRFDLGHDYHQLKEAIAKLVEDYEIPKELAPDSESKNFSNRMTTRKSTRGRGPVRNASENLGSRNPYNSTPGHSQLTNMIASQRNVSARRSPQYPRSHSNPQAGEKQENNSVLVTMLETAMYQCQARSDFVNAHMYYKTLQSLRRLSSPTLVKNGYAALLNYFSRGPRDLLSKAANAIEEFEAWFVWLKQSQERSDGMVNEMMLTFKNLRDKMWYITDVRTSKPYEDARNVALALKIMDQQSKTLNAKGPSGSRSRNVNSFLRQNEAQLVDLMSASQDFGGPNKLSDEQSEITLKWLMQYGVENFCKGEERIHRFCLEVDKCVTKVIGEGLLDGPVLWASDLYKRDQQILESGRQKGDLFLTGVGTLSIAGDEEYETHGRAGSRNPDFSQRPSHGSLRSAANRNGSSSFEQSPWGRNPMDSPDYFGASSPVLSIDPMATFWSPFQTQAQSPTNATSIRPRTASSSKGTVMLKQSATVNEDKRRFMLDLKQTLTGLLLSDLGTMVFANGSETDSWFGGDLLDDCIERRDEEERKRKNKLAKKKSTKNIRKQTPDQRSVPLEALGRTERSSAAPPVATFQHAAASDAHLSAGEHSSTSSDATSRSAGNTTAKRAGLMEFPYNVAFQRLLSRFQTHPNPYSKLHALYELELLIIASLSSRTGRSYNNNRRETLPPVPQSPTLGAMPELSSREPATQVSRAQNLEEAIANCEERRSQSMNVDRMSNASPVPRNGARSPAGPPSTDMIVEVIQGLLRDANIRPKTLFRDLQFIASFVPAQMLDKTARGKAFWDVGLAALGLKQDVCRIMVELVDEVITQNSKRDAGKASSSGSAEKAGASSSLPSLVDEPLSKYTMEDAGRMLLITAKEGDSVAERELAIFYLTSPELIHRTVLPLTKPSEVFKTELLNRERRASQDPARSDPMTMCVAQHWMEQSMKGGDQLAAKYLRQRSELENINPTRA